MMRIKAMATKIFMEMVKVRYAINLMTLELNNEVAL